MTDEIVYLGCYTKESGGTGEGIVAATRDPRSGRLTPGAVVARTPSPSFLVWHPTLPVLYAANELAEGEVSGWAVDGPGPLRPVGRAPTGGTEPCHVAVTADGRHLLAANYASGSISVHPLDPATGAVGERTDLVVHDGHGPDRDRQAGPHLHMISIDPAGGPLIAIDLGTDGLYPYRMDGDRLVPAGDPLRVAPGTGPRHVARHPDGRRAYLVGELDAMLTSFEIGDTGWRERHRLEASTRPGEKFPSEVACRADGRYLYLATRGVDTVSVFALDGAAPRLVTEVDCGGRWPRHLALAGEHLYVANQMGDSVAVFAVDPRTGVPTMVDGPIPVSSPTCVLPPRMTVIS
ncbi:lactonase family protein [Asanoa sp. NPDC050611]|uniref:lactonase family protein n=1 Tax=Asanoa sp. NPDC050611 TaxID=3157098 RepID=UPI0033D04631